MTTSPFVPGLTDGNRNGYHQYKYSCNIVNRWVHDTVVRIRAQSLADSQPPTAASGKKAKPKVQSRNSRKQHPKPVTDDLSTSYHSFSVFLKLVQEIASSEVAIPKTYLTMMSVVIKHRKAIAAFYSQATDAWRKIDSHSKIVDVYQKALDILQHAYRDRGGDESDLGLDMVDDVQSLTAAMRRLALVVEEEEAASPPEEDRENEWIRDNPLLQLFGAKEKRKQKVHPLETYELHPDDERPPRADKKKDDADEAWLALQFFLLDLDNIRNYVSSVWKTVIPNGDTSRFTASFVANHAVYLAKQLERGLVGDFPRLKDINVTQKILATKFEVILRGAPDDVAFPIRERLLSHIWKSLNEFSATLDIEDTPFPILMDPQYGRFDPRFPRESHTPTNRAREDNYILLNYLPDLFMMFKFDQTVPENGVFMGDFGLPRESRSFLVEPSHPKCWSLLFSCQLMLDALHSRRSYLQVDVDAMRLLGRKLCGEIDGFFVDGITYSPKMKEVKAVVPSIYREIEFSLLEDTVTKAKLEQGWDKLCKQECQSDTLRLYNPWLTANIMSEALVDSFMISIDVMNASGFVQSAVHLWNALKQTGHLPDPERRAAVVETGNERTSRNNYHVLLMDRLIEIIGDQVFSGLPPTQKFLTNWEYMFSNFTGEQFGRDIRKKAGPFPPDGGRILLPQDSRAWKLHTKSFVITDIDRPTTMNNRAHATHSLAYVEALVESELGQGSGSAIKGPFLNLDILKIHELCIRLFTELKVGLRTDIERVYSKPFDVLVPTQVEWPMITGWIIGSGELTESGIDEELLAKAGEIVHKVIGTKEVAHYVISDDPAYQW